MKFFPTAQFGQTIYKQWQQEILPRFRRLSPREQGLLVFSMIALPIILFVYGIWLPVMDNIHVLEKSMPALQNQLREAQGLAAQLQQTGRKPSDKHNVLALIEQAAKVSGVRQYITRIKPQPSLGGGERFLTRIHQVPYPHLVKFLDHLAKRGVVIARAKLMGSKPGMLETELTLE